MQGIASFLIGPEGELYKCWNDIGKEEKVIGTVDSKKLKHTSLLLKYLLHSSSFNEECRECKVFPVCEGGCGYDRYRNRFEGGRFSVCTHLKKPEIFGGSVAFPPVCSESKQIISNHQNLYL